MPYKCCIVTCNSNYDTEEETTTTFGFPDEEEEPDRRERWIRFVNRKDSEWNPETARICEKHFEPMYIKEGKRNRLVKALRSPCPRFSIQIPRRAPSYRILKHQCPYRGNLQENEYFRKTNMDNF